MGSPSHTPCGITHIGEVDSTNEIKTWVVGMNGLSFLYNSTIVWVLTLRSARCTIFQDGGHNMQNTHSYSQFAKDLISVPFLFNIHHYTHIILLLNYKKFEYMKKLFIAIYVLFYNDNSKKY